MRKLRKRRKLRNRSHVLSLLRYQDKLIDEAHATINQTLVEPESKLRFMRRILLEACVKITKPTDAQPRTMGFSTIERT